jgi:hypothetical protein
MDFRHGRLELPPGVLVRHGMFVPGGQGTGGGA